MSSSSSSIRDCTIGRRNGSVSPTLLPKGLNADNRRLLKLYEKHLPAASHEGESEVELHNKHPEHGNGSIMNV